IAYLLHRFPRMTDTFIRREIRSLQAAGMDVQVISVWRPSERDVSSELLGQWSREVSFLLPRSLVLIVLCVVRSMILSPARFLGALGLALRTSRPGLRGHLYQSFYFVEAILAA